MSTFTKYFTTLSSAIFLAGLGIAAHASTEKNQNKLENNCLQQAQEAGLSRPDEIQEYIKECVKTQQEVTEQTEQEQGNK